MAARSSDAGALLLGAAEIPDTRLLGSVSYGTLAHRTVVVLTRVDMAQRLVIAAKLVALAVTILVYETPSATQPGLPSFAL
jgi:hypothetical protein